MVRRTHNLRKERLWKDVFSGALSYFYDLFYFMEEEDILDPLNNLNLSALNYVYLPQINSKLEWRRQAWSKHRLKKSTLPLYNCGYLVRLTIT